MTSLDRPVTSLGLSELGAAVMEWYSHCPLVMGREGWKESRRQTALFGIDLSGLWTRKVAELDPAQSPSTESFPYSLHVDKVKT